MYVCTCVWTCLHEHWRISLLMFTCVYLYVCCLHVFIFLFVVYVCLSFCSLFTCVCRSICCLRCLSLCLLFTYVCLCLCVFIFLRICCLSFCLLFTCVYLSVCCLHVCCYVVYVLGSGTLSSSRELWRRERWSRGSSGLVDVWMSPIWWLVAETCLLQRETDLYSCYLKFIYSTKYNNIIIMDLRKNFYNL